MAFWKMVRLGCILSYNLWKWHRTLIPPSILSDHAYSYSTVTVSNSSREYSKVCVQWALPTRNSPRYNLWLKKQRYMHGKQLLCTAWSTYIGIIILLLLYKSPGSEVGRIMITLPQLGHTNLNISFSSPPVSVTTYRICLHYCLETPATLLFC